jgi:hypothetical protein
MASILDSVRQPEYTGENRCIPCTVANAVIAVLGSTVVVGALVVADAGASVAAAAGGVVLFASATAIYLRGYLVPGTPTLTKRYFPEWVLAKFDKLPEEGSGGLESDGAGTESDGGEDIDPEAALLSAGAVQPCEREDDLCLAPDFREAWEERIRAVEAGGVDTGDVVAALSIEDLAAGATLSEFGEAVILERDGREVGKWESRAALVADVAAAEVLAERYDRWDRLGGVERSQLLRGLRIFLEECPLCSGPMGLGQDTVESCCRSYEVVAVTCGRCDSRLFEERWEGTPA